MANRLNVQNIYASDSDTTAAVQVSGANVTLNGTANDLGTVTAGTLGADVNFNPAIGQLAFWHGYSSVSSSITCTLDGINTYVVLITGRYESSPLYTVNLSFMIDSSDGTITKKTDTWSVKLNESFNNSTKVLTLSSDSNTSIMNALIFKGAVTEMT